MTEKRFYYNTFYHRDDMSRVLEYEIIDRQSYSNYPNHDEKEDIPQWYIYISENDSGWQDMLVDLLNELHETIQSLTSDSEKYRKLSIQFDNCNKELVSENALLEKENEQLKQQEKRLYNYFRKCFDNVSEQSFQETWEVVKKYD